MENRCVCCGSIIPEGRQICRECEVNVLGAVRNTYMKDYGLSYDDGKKGIRGNGRQRKRYIQRLLHISSLTLQPVSAMTAWETFRCSGRIFRDIEGRR